MENAWLTAELYSKPFIVIRILRLKTNNNDSLVILMSRQEVRS